MSKSGKSRKCCDYFIQNRSDSPFSREIMAGLLPGREAIRLMAHIGKNAACEVDVWPCHNWEELVRVCKALNNGNLRFQPWRRPKKNENENLKPVKVSEVLRDKIDLSLVQPASKSMRRRIEEMKRA
jgi:hypothetical protein